MSSVRGFSLLEMAVVLVVIGLALGGLLAPLGASVQQRRLDATEAALALAAEVLSGYAVIHGRLPCPDADADGDEDCPLSGEGTLPWRTLGLTRAQARDAWHNPLRYRPDAAFVGTAVADPPATIDGLRLADMAGQPLTALNPAAPAAVLLSRGADGLGNAGNDTDDGRYTQGPPCTSGCAVYFDDQVTAYSTYLLIARLAAAGRWP
ncbi:MAG: prepilin-type N-terminal cleavage/methylation domain-containing protein [Gammaproteobacteria bacterium]|nr:prepilin-type N-terminal cleavage/methylation domain-containing protein [Gammaproteobacteria bacterium]